jgi:hypothetical protein
MSDILKNYADSSEDSSYETVENVVRTGGVNSHQPFVARRNKPTTKQPVHRDDNKRYRVMDTSLKTVVKVRGKPDREYIIPEFQLSAVEHFIDRSTVLYGISGSGKTVSAKDIMHNMKDMFPRVFVFAPTNESTGDYNGIIVKPMIYEKVTLDKIADIYEYARMAKSIYENANNLKILDKIFLRVASTKAKIHLRRMIDAYEKCLKRISKQEEDIGRRKEARKQLKDKFDNMLRRFYKKVIMPNRNRLKLMRLSDKEKFSLEYLSFNPRTLVIFDDAMTEVDKLIKKGHREENEVIQNFFFRGRHDKITQFYTMQSDKRLDAELRKNTFMSLFTSKSEAMAFFGRKANGFTLEEKKIAEAVVDVIFSEVNQRDYKKLIYIKDSKSPWQWYSADQHDTFIMGCPSLRMLCKQVEKKGSQFDTENKFHDIFAKKIRD